MFKQMFLYSVGKIYDTFDDLLSTGDLKVVLKCLALLLEFEKAICCAIVKLYWLTSR